jgi:hypothetical protein
MHTQSQSSIGTMESTLVNHEHNVGPGGRDISEEKWHESYEVIKGRDSNHSVLTHIVEAHKDLSAMDVADVGKKTGELKPRRRAHKKDEECTCCWQCSYCLNKLVKFNIKHLKSDVCKLAQLALVPNAMV